MARCLGALLYIYCLSLLTAVINRFDAALSAHCAVIACLAQIEARPQIFIPQVSLNLTILLLTLALIYGTNALKNDGVIQNMYKAVCC